MSFLMIFIAGVSYRAKVLNFSTSLAGTIATVQNRRYLQHFPTKVEQPSLSLQLQMSSTREARRFQDLVRSHHKQALVSGTPVRLSWGARGMDDWSGIITACQAGESASVPIPKLNIDLLLTDSLVTRRTWGSSKGADVSAIYQGEIPDLPSLDSSGYKEVVEKIYGEELVPPSTPVEPDKEK